MIPSFFVSIEKMPLTANGKIDRKALPAHQIRTGEDYSAPRDEVEEKLVQIWSDILGIEKNKLSIEKNFFQLGGHSLKATVMVSNIHKRMNTKIPLREIFKHPTIKGLANKIRGTEIEPHAAIEPVEKREYYPLSSAQMRLYVLQQMESASCSYNIPAAFRVEGFLNTVKLEETFLGLVRGHESLRTSFHMIAEEPVQRIHGNVDFKIREIGPIGPIGPLENIINGFVRPFELSMAPLLRVGLVETGENQFILMLDMHHIISDGISIGILIKDFPDYYAGEALEPLRIQYKDFSTWQIRKKESIKKQEVYWRKEYEDEIPVLELPYDFTRPTVQSFKGDTIGFTLTLAETASLNRLANENSATLFMVLLAIYNVFLTKISTQETIVVGTPIAGRRHADLEPVIGMFVNTLALKNDPAGEKTFDTFLREVKTRSVEAFENQDYQYEELVEAVAVNRDTGRNPLFDTMFALQNLENVELEIPGLTLKPYPYENKTSKFDLSLTGIDTSDQILFEFEYCSDLFKHETIERFINYFKKTVSSILADPVLKISQIDIVPEEEKKKLLYDFNDTVADYPKDKTIHRFFEEQVERTPDKAAVIGHCLLGNRGAQLTYGELNRVADRLSYVLQEKGVGPDTIVAIKIKRSIEMFIGILGILKTGGAYLPISPNLPQDRIDNMLKDSNAALILTGNDMAVMGEHEDQAEPLRKPGKGDQVVGARPCLCVRPINLAYIIYTSGTTANPRGVLVEHAAVVNRLFWVKDRYRLDETGGWTFMFTGPGRGKRPRPNHRCYCQEQCHHR
jgi:acyl carrier protein